VPRLIFAVIAPHQGCQLLARDRLAAMHAKISKKTLHLLRQLPRTTTAAAQPKWTEELQTHVRAPRTMTLPHKP
jgi:hypothetical protein